MQTLNTVGAYIIAVNQLLNFGITYQKVNFRLLYLQHLCLQIYELLRKMGVFNSTLLAGKIFHLMFLWHLDNMGKLFVTNYNIKNISFIHFIHDICFSCIFRVISLLLYLYMYVILNANRKYYFKFLCVNTFTLILDVNTFVF